MKYRSSTSASVLTLALSLTLSLLLTTEVSARKLYVAPPDHATTPGNDLTGNGSLSKPWATFQKAFYMATPGDTVYFRGGIYYSTKKSEIDPLKFGGAIGKSGTRENPICYFGFPGEWPVLDCKQHCDTPGTTYNYAILINHAQYIRFKDIEVRNVFQCDGTITGAISASYSANLTFEHVIIHDVGQRGYWIQGGAWGEYTQDPKPLWDHDTTRWINCDVYNLCDSISVTGNPPKLDPGNAADAWKTIHYKGNYLLWDGCRAWNYTDDGYDPSPINGAVRVFKDCWAIAGDKYKNYDPDLDGNVDAERNGFKINGLTTFPSVEFNTIIMTNCIAFNCNFGIYEISDRHNGIYLNNTSYRNGIGFAGSGATVDNPRSSIYRNNITYASTSLDPGLKKPYNVSLMGPKYIETNNTWDWISGYPNFVMTDTVTVSDADFISLVSDQLTAPRNPDGSLPDITFLNLANGSDLIDAGYDVGMYYTGSAPDIGALERTTVPGTSNRYPYVTIISPANGNSYTKPGDIFDVKANASDPDGSVSKLEFFLDTVKLGEKTAPPWAFTVKNAPVGNHFIRVVATDNQNAKSTSSRIRITINPGNYTEQNPDASVLYPNPNGGVFTLFLTTPLKRTGNVTITSSDGKMVYKGTFLQEQMTKQIDISYLNSGLYILFLSDNDIFQAYRFIKQ